MKYAVDRNAPSGAGAPRPRARRTTLLLLDPGDPRFLELWDAAGIGLRAPEDVVHGLSCLERLAHRPKKRLPFGLQQKLEEAERLGVVGHVPDPGLLQ